jgi:hypothetical protein
MRRRKWGQKNKSINFGQILFTYNPMIDRLLERHIVIGSQAPPEEFVYQINPEGNLDLVS